MPSSLMRSVGDVFEAGEGGRVRLGLGRFYPTFACDDSQLAVDAGNRSRQGMRCRPEQWGYLIFNTKEMTDLIE
ncbi:hypothetical protein [Paenibacillus sp. 1P03SA]|uniref:hypothetical protein n=1 Tax=Paenibacillus sp. 1P03SA TaxID=3132294 RepID=UPI0039A0E22F